MSDQKNATANIGALTTRSTQQGRVRKGECQFTKSNTTSCVSFFVE